MIGTPLKIKLWNKILKGENFISHPVYVSLHTGDPGNTGANEISGGGYSRQQAPGSNWFVNEVGETEIFDITLTFLGLPAGTITHAGLWSPAAEFLVSGPLQTPATVADGDSFRFNPGALRGLWT